jgi:DNA-binding response OmpR family regulator
MNKPTENLLIVDDEQMIIQLLQEYFVNLNYGVEVAYSAEEALEKLNDGVVFDLVISDINLPGKSGIDLLKIIRELKENLPVVMLTGLKTLDNAISAVKSGAADYITKPFDLKSIHQVVDRILKKQHRIHWKEQIFEHLTYIKNSFTFKTNELDPGILSKELASILNKIQFASQAEIGQFELAFTEILINAIEHGNLELPSYKKKGDLFKKTEFDELKEQRIKIPEYGDRAVDVIFEADTDLFNFTVRDQGPGFDWRTYMGKAHNLKRVDTEIFGRGFKIIQHISDEVHFNDKGNIITMIKNRPQST